jgi:hypothetical protein
MLQRLKALMVLCPVMSIATGWWTQCRVAIGVASVAAKTGKHGQLNGSFQE